MAVEYTDPTQVDPNNPVPAPGIPDSVATSRVATPPKANAATPPQSAISGLMDALNRKQDELVRNKIYEYADSYSIEFQPAWLGDSVFQKPGSTDFKQTPMGTSTNGLADPSRTTPVPGLFKRQFEAGTPISTIISRVLTESSFVYNQQYVTINKDGQPVANGTPAQNFSWFNVVGIVTPTGLYDRRRKDFAYDIKYVVTTYETPVYSEYFPNSRFRGVHKDYVYWFTGQNTEVLNFEVASNTAYWNVINTPTPGTQERNSSVSPVKQSYSPRSKESDQGAAERVNDIAANAADWLYNARDYASIKLKILGDPDWINTINFNNKSDVTSAPFLDDGSINYVASAAYFSFNYNLGDDYDTDTGLMNIIGGAAEQTKNYADDANTRLSLVYSAVESVASFRKGRFEIELEGRLKPSTRSDNIETAAPVRETTAIGAAGPSRPRPGTLKTTKEPEWAKLTSVTGTTPTSAIAKGTQQILNQPVRILTPTLTELQNSPVYIQARRNGVPAQQALEQARRAFAEGTNTFNSNSTQPGSSRPTQPIVRDP